MKRLEADRYDGQIALRMLRTELRMATSVLSNEIERLRRVIKDALRPGGSPNAWRALQIESLKMDAPPSELYQHTITALAFLREQEGNDAGDPSLGARVLNAHSSPPATMPLRRPASSSPSTRTSRAAAAAAANHAAAVRVASGASPTEEHWWQAHEIGSRFGGSKAWRDRPRYSK